MNFSDRILTLAAEAEAALAPHFARIDRIAFENTQKVMDAFRSHRVAMTNFDSTSGYGYDDRGRDVLDAVWADVFGCEAALVRQQIVSGTQAASAWLYFSLVIITLLLVALIASKVVFYQRRND